MSTTSQINSFYKEVVTREEDLDLNTPEQSKEDVPGNRANEPSEEKLHIVWTESRVRGLPGIQGFLDERTARTPAEIGSLLLLLGSRPFAKKLQVSKGVRDWWMQQIPSQLTARSRSSRSDPQK